MERPQSLRIVQIKDMYSLTKGFESGLVKLYQDIFSEPPYYEHFDEDEIQAAFTTYTKEGILFLIYYGKEVVGFGAAMPFLKSAVANLREQFEFDLERTWYMADLGIHKDMRRRGLAIQIVQARLNELASGSSVIMRTSKDNVASRSLYHLLGFKILPLTQMVSQRRQNGDIEMDERIFMAKTLKSPNVISDSEEISMVKVRLWKHRDESPEVVYYKVPVRVVAQLTKFVETGKVESEILPELQSALQKFPSWAHLTLGELLHKEQRRSVAGYFVIDSGQEVTFETSLDLDVVLY